MLRWLDEGGDPNARNDSFDGSSVSLLDCAAFAGHATLVRELLARGADPRSTDVTGWSAMHAAASSESRVNPAGVVALLADAGANVNARVERRVEYDSDGEFYVVGGGNPPTPLMCAARGAVSVEVVRVLLSRGADIAATRDDGATAMEYAPRTKLGAPIDGGHHLTTYGRPHRRLLETLHGRVAGAIPPVAEALLDRPRLPL